VREGAALTLFELDPAGCADELARLAGDSDAKVARFARHVLALAHHDKEKEALVLSTVEKLLVLRATPMFAKLRGDDLAPLAHVAEVERYDAGETIFDE